MSDECRCDWCIGKSGSDDLSLAEKAVQIDNERKDRENNPADRERRQEIGNLLRRIGVIR